ncbi:hypothetical protein [Pedobacter alpinus]|uniref:DUF5362 domain-containing protein n=1 Tax=Pedobacter alpinus TaxID=1590643 RepID=A0ABW5TTT0_9SPHI
MQEDQNIPTPVEEQSKPLKFDDHIKNIIAEIAKWGKFVGIVGFVLSGLILIIGLAFMFMGETLSTKLAALGQPANSATAVVGFAYAVVAIIYYFPSRYLYDFAVYAKQAVEFNDQESINYSFERLKTLFRFIGIIAIMFIGFYAMILIISVFGALFSAVL